MLRPASLGIRSRPQGNLIPRTSLLRAAATFAPPHHPGALEQTANANTDASAGSSPSQLPSSTPSPGSKAVTLDYPSPCSPSPQMFHNVDWRITPSPGYKYAGIYDHLSAYNTAATPLPIWHKGTEFSHRFEDGKVPLLWNIENTWELYDGDTRERIKLHLQDLMEGNWKEMTIHEKKAAWYIALGPWGPRAPRFKGDERYDLIRNIIFGIVGLGVLYQLTGIINPPSQDSLATEWQRQMNINARARGEETIPGILSPDYSGKGFIKDGGPYSNKGQTF